MTDIDRVLIVDSETTGLDPKSDFVVEVAAVLFSLKHVAVIETFQALIHGTSNPAEHINRIPAEILHFGMNSASVWGTVAEMISRADCILAHNAPFDRSFIERQIDNIEIPWVCSMRDIDWPEKSESRKLVEVVIAHGVPVIGAHRALTDVDMLVRLLHRVADRGVNLTALFKDATTPKPLVAALVPFERKDEAKAAGFSWNAGVKRWEKKMTLEAAKKLPFKTRVVEQA